MAKCFFCTKQIEPGRGLIFVEHEHIYHFCSSKCFKNRKLGRDKRKVKWIKKARKTKAEIKQELLEEAREAEEKAEESKEILEKAKEEKAGEKEEKKK
jgi:large subunit ribosomal protein L24e